MLNLNSDQIKKTAQISKLGVPNPNADADVLSGAYATILKNEGFTKSEDANNDYMGVWGHRHSG